MPRKDISAADENRQLLEIALKDLPLRIRTHIRTQAKAMAADLKESIHSDNPAAIMTPYLAMALLVEITDMLDDWRAYKKDHENT